MNEREYLKITGNIDERFVNEYQNYTASRVVSIRKRISTGLLVAAAVALMVPIGVYAAKKLIHHDKVSILYGEDGVKMIEENLSDSEYTVENDYFRLTVDVQISDGNFTEVVWTVTARTDEAKKHLENIDRRCVDTVTGDRIGFSGDSTPDLNSDEEVTWRFVVPVTSHPARFEFFEDVPTGKYHCYYGAEVEEDYTYYEGICFDVLSEPNVPTKVLRSPDGKEITLSPYGLSVYDETSDDPKNGQAESISSLVYISTDGERVNIFTDQMDGRIETDLDDVNISVSGEFGTGYFSMNIGTAFNVDNIIGVEINGVPYMAE